MRTYVCTIIHVRIHVYMCTCMRCYLRTRVCMDLCTYVRTYVHSDLCYMSHIRTYVRGTYDYAGKCFTCHVASLPSPPLLPPHLAKPLFGIMGSRSPASFQLGNIAAQFEEEEEEEEGSEDSPTQDEEVGSHNAAAAFVPGHVFVHTYGGYVRSYVCVYVRTYVSTYV